MLLLLRWLHWLQLRQLLLGCLLLCRLHRALRWRLHWRLLLLLRGRLLQGYKLRQLLCHLLHHLLDLLVHVLHLLL